MVVEPVHSTTFINGGIGTPYLQLSDAGPMTYAHLPRGHSCIMASYQGKSETRHVAPEGKAGRNVFFTWQGPAQPSR